jgi:hypothetical protein
MKRLLLLIALSGIVAGQSHAGRNANGMMLVHTDDAVVYTATADYCSSTAPPRCEDFVNTSHMTAEDVTVIWLMAAFVQSSSPGVTTVQFGIHHNLPSNQGYFERFSPCGPQYLELPDAGWPELNDCGNLVAYGVPVYDHTFPFYWFAVWHDDDNSFFGTRTYPSTNEAKFVDDGNPPIEDLCFAFATLRWNVPGEMNCFPDWHFGACCYPDGHCEFTRPEDCTGTYMGDGVQCDPNPCQMPQVCCFPDGSCWLLLPEVCAAQGGLPLDFYTCDPNPCGPPPMGACCYDTGICVMTYSWDCGGVFQGVWTDCDPNPCPASGACCLDMDGNCVVLTADACVAQGGVYQGDGSTCEPENPCGGFPTQHTTWGRIKADYR